MQQGPVRMAPFPQGVPFVWGFQKPHPIGSICGPSCPICADTQTHSILENGEIGVVHAFPMYIVRQATPEEHVRSVRARGYCGVIFGQYPYYYEVSID